MENTVSHSSCISPAAATSMSAGESSWVIHFLASSNNRQEMDHQGGASDSGFSSSSLGDDSSFVMSDLMFDDDDEEDDSLQDTACSSVAGPKVTSMNDMCMKSMVAMDAKEINTTPQLAKYFLDVGLRQQVTGAVQEVISGENNNYRQLYECNDLRKKGLCLVPLSMLAHYL